MVTAEEFYDLVQKDVRNQCDQHELEVLGSDLDQWLIELKALKRDVEIQSTAQRARIAQKQAEMLSSGASTAEWKLYKAKEDNWKVTAMRFTACVEQRLAHVKALRSQTHQKTMAA